MNKKEFEIWRKQKDSEYQEELENLQNDFASRGLVSSGMRNVAEQRLKDRHNRDVKLMEQQVHREARENKRFWISLIIEIVLAASAITSAIYMIRTFEDQSDLNRPYLAIDASQMKEQLNVQHSDPSAVLQALQEGAAYPYNDSFTFTIQNVGKLPAKYRVDLSEFKHSGLSNILPPANETGFIFPNQIIELKYDLQGTSNTEGVLEDEANRIISLSKGNFESASKIKVFYGYTYKQVFNFETRIEERIIEQNCDDRPTSNMQCFSNPEWTVIGAN